MTTAHDVRAALIERLEPAALTCVAGDAERLPWRDLTRVSDFEVQEAARCQAKVAGPADPFEPRIATAFRAIAHRAFDELVERDDVLTSSDQADVPGSPGRAGGWDPRVVDAVSSAMRGARRQDDWLGRYLIDEPLAVRVQIAVRSTTWLTRTLDLIGGGRRSDVDGSALRSQGAGSPSPGTGQWAASRSLAWSYPGRGLRLTGKLDLVHRATPRPSPAGSGQPDHETPVLVVPSWSEVAEAKMAFLALLWAIETGELDAVLQVLVHATGERIARPVGDDIWRGIDAAERAVTAVVRRTSTPDGLERSPATFTCDGCAWFETCDARLDSVEARVDRAAVRGGVRLSAVR